MCNIFRAQWTVIPRSAPRPWIACGNCGSLKPFTSSGKIRLNANGRRLDAWLIYKCLDCAKTWNRPLLERENVRSIDCELLEALQSNDPEWIRKQEFDIDGLRRYAQRVDQVGSVDVYKQGSSQGRDPTRLEIAFVVPLQTSMRLDRLLSAELGLSRSQLHALHADAELQCHPNGREILRRRIRHQTVITLDIPPDADRKAIIRAAGGRRDS